MRITIVGAAAIGQHLAVASTDHTHLDAMVSIARTPKQLLQLPKP